MPQKYSHEYIAEQFYRPAIFGEDIASLAKRLSKAFKVNEKSSVLDLQKLPLKKLFHKKDSPEVWGDFLLRKLCKLIDPKQLGHVSVSYNISSSNNILPNIGSQMVQMAGLEPEWLDHRMGYGCAAGVLSVEDALLYCSTRKKMSAVITFDQCQWAYDVPDIDDEDFKAAMVTNLLFADGAVGLLIAPGETAKKMNSPKLRVFDLVKYFLPGDVIKMRNGRFIMADAKGIMPRLVVDNVIAPLLHRNGLNKKDIDEWSIHQGGPEILKQFASPEILGLSEQNIARSLELFYKHGNLSAPSCLFVLESFFNSLEEKNKGDRRIGMVVGFGAGYYLGGFLYEWIW